MTDTTWNSAKVEPAPGDALRASGMLAGLWNRRVIRPLHRALDAALRAGELRELSPATLADIGYRRV